MRISSQVFFQRNTNNILKHQADLSQQNIHMAAQKRVIHGSDDPVAISTIQRLKQDVSVNDQFINNGKLGETANELEETSLKQSVNILQKVRELLVKSGDGTYNEENRESLAKELEQLKKELIGVANTRDGNSQFIFSGYEVDTKPFQVNEFGSVDYHGDTGSKDYKVGPGVTVKGNNSGQQVFMDIPEGNGTFVSQANSTNKGSGIIDEAIVFDDVAANGFLGEDYTVSFNEPAPGSPVEYSVYGLKKASVSGNATVKIAGVDLNDASIANVNPSAVFPDTTGPNGNNVNVTFLATATAGQFELQLNGVSSLPAIYDANITTAQTLKIDGISMEIKGIPAATDTYALTKYVGPTEYLPEQNIEFNGIKTEVKGDPIDQDSFTLRQSGKKDIFSSIQNAIDALRVPGEDDTSDAKRLTDLNMVKHQIDAALGNVTEVRSEVGARLRTIDNQRSSSEDFKLTTQRALSNLEDLDMAQAISEFQLSMTQLEVTQQTFVKLQQLSLFNHI